jgi:hypothetical protein
MADAATQSVLLNRPLIEAEIVTSNEMFTEAGDRYAATFQVSLTNHSTHAAFNVEYAFDIGFQRRLLFKGPNPTCGSRTGSLGVLRPYGTVSVRQFVVFGPATNQDGVMGPFDPRVIPVIYGCVRYLSASFRDIYETSVGAELRVRVVEHVDAAIDRGWLSQPLDPPARFTLVPTAAWNYVK